MTDLARAKWRSSGLTDEHAAKLSYEELPAERLPQMAGNLAPVPSLFLPYFDLDGQRTDFYRVRYLAKPPGFMGVVEKPQRYAQAAGSLNEVYLPPLLPELWRVIAGDPTRTVYVTEGELKAAAACTRGYPTVGLGGVDVWRSAKQAKALLAPLDQFVWKGREVFIVFDSDAHTNSNVVRAQRQFAQEMTRVGAKPQIVSLTPGPDGAKQGLDDYLLAATDAEFDALVAASPGYDEAAVLWDLNERVVYVQNPGMVVRRDNGYKMLPGPFQAHHFANVTYTEAVSQGKDRPARLVHKPAAERWVRWSARAELDGITYAPGHPKVHGDQWNEWDGWGCEPVPGNVQPWHQLLDLAFSHDAVARKWFEQWCAYPVQYPGTKLYTAVVLWSTLHGAGKTLLGYMLGEVYGKNFIEIRRENLESAFNSWACGRQFVLGDEITGNDSREFADRIKGLVTRAEITVNEKHQPLFRIPDTVNYLFTSNHPDAFYMEDDDRRFFIHQITTKGTDAFYAECDKWLWDDGGAGHLFNHLLHVDLTGFNPNAAALVTSAKREMVLITKSDVATWVADLITDPHGTLGGTYGESAYYCDLWTSEQLLLAYTGGDTRSKVTGNGMARELKRAGFSRYKDGQPVDMGPQGQKRLFVLRNAAIWSTATRDEVRSHWLKHFEKSAPKYHGDYTPPTKEDK